MKDVYVVRRKGTALCASNVPEDGADNSQGAEKSASADEPADQGPQRAEGFETPLPSTSAVAIPDSGAHPITSLTIAGFIVLTVAILLLASYVVGTFWPASPQPSAGPALGRLACITALTAVVAVPWWRWRWSRRTMPETASSPSTIEPAPNVEAKNAGSSGLLTMAVVATVALGVAFFVSLAWFAHAHAENATATAIQPVIDSPLKHFSRESWGVSFDYPGCLRLNEAELAEVRAAAPGPAVTFSWVTDADAESHDEHPILITLSRKKCAPVPKQQAREDAAAGAAYLDGQKGVPLPGTEDLVQSAEAVELDGRPALHIVTRSREEYPQNVRRDLYVIQCPRCTVILDMSLPEGDYKTYETSSLISNMVSSLQLP
jgi:hypothetical protein